MEFLLVEHDNVMLDNEIDGIPSEYGETSLHNSDAVRTAVNGHINQFIRGTAPDGLDMKFRVNVFDMLTLDEFRSKSVSPDQTERYKRLDSLFEGVSFRNIVRDKPSWIENPDEARVFYLNIVSNKGEGAMFKDPNKPYQVGDSQYWVKAKQQVDVEMEITGFYKGSKGGKREHTIGGVSMRSSDGKIEVNSGSGLKDSDIEFILENQDELIGRIVTLRFNTIIDKKTSDVKSFFLPRFQGGNKTTGNFVASLRDDKDVANSLEEIKLAEEDAQRFLFKG
jgi:ATP-dependent DNA ligase